MCAERHGIIPGWLDDNETGFAQSSSTPDRVRAHYIRTLRCLTEASGILRRADNEEVDLLALPSLSAADRATYDAALDTAVTGVASAISNLRALLQMTESSD